MNKYVVAVYFYQTDELKQEVVNANSRLEAAKSYMNDHEEWQSLVAMQKHYCGSDMAKISVIEISKTQKAFSWQFPSMPAFRA